jgi:hypothetical protein
MENSFVFLSVFMKTKGAVAVFVAPSSIIISRGKRSRTSQSISPDKPWCALARNISEDLVYALYPCLVIVVLCSLYGK